MALILMILTRYVFVYMAQTHDHINKTSYTFLTTYVYQRKLPVPGFKVEIVMIDYDGTAPDKYKANEKPSICSTDSSPSYKHSTNSSRNKASNDQENDNVFSDSDDEDKAVSTKQTSTDATSGPGTIPPPARQSGKTEAEVATLRKNTQQLSLNSKQQSTSDNRQVDKSILSLNSDIKAIAADASVFSFGDDEDYESE